MKMGKASGSPRVVAEMIQVAGVIGIQWLKGAV